MKRLLKINFHSCIVLQLSIFLTLLSTAHGNSCESPSPQQKLMAAQYFEEASYFVRFLLDQKVNPTFTVVNGKPFLLSEVFTKMKEICFTREMSLLSLDGIASNVSCNSLFVGQWQTKYDNKLHRAIVGVSDIDFTHNFSEKQRFLLLHEALGALGVTDDEYQVSSVVVSLVQKIRNKEAVTSEAASALLQNISIHKNAPRFTLGQSEGCYEWQGGMGTLMASKGGATAVGGAGDGPSMAFKVALLNDAQSWWSKNKKGEDYEQFFQRLLKLGVEPRALFNRSLKFLVPIGIFYRLSKRTGHEAAVLYAEDFLGDARNWNTAKEMVYSEIYFKRMHGLPQVCPNYGSTCDFENRFDEDRPFSEE